LVVGRPWRRIASFSTFLALVFYSLLALITTHPLWLNLAEAVPGDIGDPLLNTWIMAWDAHAILTAPLHLFDANIYYPLPNTLAYSEHLFSTAALVLPLGVVSGQPALAYNLSLLLSFPLAGLGMYLLVLRWTQRRAAALLAGLAFAFTPYRLAAVAHLQLLTVQWLPFSLLALDGMLKSQITNHKSQIANHKSQITNHKSQIARYWLLFVIFTTLQVLASWYLAVFTALVLGLYTLGWWAAGRKKEHQPPPCRPHASHFTFHVSRFTFVARLAVAALAVATLALPFALPYLEVLPELQAARPPALAASFGARPADFLAAAPYLRLAGPLTRGLAARPGFTEENTLFLGVVAPLLALAGLAVGRPRWCALTLGAILLVSLALTFAAPYQALTGLLPALSVVRVPPRWIIPATFALAALAGLGVAGIRGSGDQGSGKQETQSRVAPVPDPPSPVSPIPDSPLPLLIGLLLLVESFAAPLPLAAVGERAEILPVYYALQGEMLRGGDKWAVVELPMHVAPAPEFPETKRMLTSILGWWGLVNGYSGFTPARQVALGQRLAGFPDDMSLAALRDLGSDGVRYLVVHPGEAPMDRAAWETTYRWEAERGTSLLPAGRFGPQDLYRINPYGDDLVTNPAAVADPYWSAHAPTPVQVRFTEPASGVDIWLLASSQSTSLPIYQSPHLPTETRLTLYWQTSAALHSDYTVFVHSLDFEGKLAGQADGPPLADHYPTSAWRPGEIVQDSRLVPPGQRYLVGLYDPVSGERLPAFAADGTPMVDDAAALVPVGDR